MARWSQARRSQKSRWCLSLTTHRHHPYPSLGNISAAGIFAKLNVSEQTVTRLSSEVGARRGSYERKAIKENKAPSSDASSLPLAIDVLPSCRQSYKYHLSQQPIFFLSLSLCLLRRKERRKIREDKKIKTWRRYDCLPRQMASISISRAPYSFTISSRPCISGSWGEGKGGVDGQSVDG